MGQYSDTDARLDSYINAAEAAHDAEVNGWGDGIQFVLTGHTRTDTLSIRPEGHELNEERRFGTWRDGRFRIVLTDDAREMVKEHGFNDAQANALLDFVTEHDSAFDVRNGLSYFLGRQNETGE